MTLTLEITVPNTITRSDAAMLYIAMADHLQERFEGITDIELVNSEPTNPHKERP